MKAYGHTKFMNGNNPNDRFAAARKLGFRSGLEATVAAQLDEAGVAYDYEAYKLPFIQPAKDRSYAPDYILPSGIIIETKGRFVTADRQKHLLIQDQHPELDIRFIFSNPRSRISKKSKTTYAMWSEKNGFQYAAKVIPEDWLTEPANPQTVKVTMDLLGWKPPRKRRRKSK